MNDSQRKLDWARKHLAIVQDSFRDFVRADGNSVDVQYDSKLEEYVVVARAKGPVPDDWSLMLGDIIHNIRSSLDSLMFALVERHAPGGLSRAEIERIQFLICDTRAEFEARVAHKQRVRWYPPIVAVMERLQPYHLQHGLGPSPLSVLRDLSNIDKHRHIVTTSIISHSVSAFFRMPSGEQVHRGSPFIGPFADGVVIARWPAFGSGLDPREHSDPILTVDIAFGKEGPTPDAPVRRVIESIIAHTTAYVHPPLSKFL